MAVELDDLDRRILEVLLADARTPASQIADQIGLSRPAVADRIEKLESSGVIRGTTAVIDHQILGREVTAFVAARGRTLDPKQWKLFRQLMRGDEILEVHTVAGDDCFFIKVRTDTIQSLNALVNKLTNPPLSLVTKTTIVMKTHCEKLGGITLSEEESS
jgi:Lrp/AsnC family leucine-responsive transcriptional regulator